ncbi:hypothetical protein EYR38_002475 [Pleurotus pulmonarius]|nr:hypothetical protein EYR38_002475 [Pleurotus pulmonarius]
MTANCLLDNSNKLVQINFEGLVTDVLKVFQLFEPWSQVEFTVDDESMKVVVEFIKTQSQAFRCALSQTIQTSNNYLELSGGALDLCHGRLAAAEDSSILDFLIDKSNAGVIQAEDVVKRFGTLRQGISDLTSLIPYVAMRVEFEISRREKSKQRYGVLLQYARSAKESIHFVEGKVVPIVNPFINAAIPGLGIVLPLSLSVSTLVVDAVAQLARSKIQKREREILAWKDAIRRLQNISSLIDSVIGHLNEFSEWWKTIGSVFLDLKQPTSAATSSDASPSWDLALVLEDFITTSQLHRCYISKITCLEDFFPAIASRAEYISPIISGIPFPRFGLEGISFQLKNYFPCLLQSIAKSREQYSATHRSLRNTALDAEDLRLLSQSFKEECGILDNALASMTFSKHLGHIPSTDIPSVSEDAYRKFHRNLCTLAGACTITRASFDKYKRDLPVARRCQYLKELRSFKKAMEKQHEGILELLFTTHYFPTAVFKPMGHHPLLQVSPDLEIRKTGFPTINCPV